MRQSHNLHIDDIFDFYEQRGYRNAVGPGEHPAVLVIDFSNAFTGGRSEFPGGDFAEEVRHTLCLLDAARKKPYLSSSQPSHILIRIGTLGCGALRCHGLYIARPKQTQWPSIVPLA
jgi:hypothetical protein